ncbi:uncharacterized protein LOC111272725 isoform X3 [Varroa jacobsoni]|nr:uncharacterized protein LOC111272725 isoform X3 [Varroa jacobsoni]
MNPKRRASACDRRSPDVYSTSSAASSTKNTNSTSQHHHASQAATTLHGARPRFDLQDCLREMNSVMRVLDNAQLDPQMRLDELNSILNGGTGGVADNCGETLTPLSMSATRELDTLLRNQQSLLRQIADSRSQLTALEYQYQQAGGGLQTNGCGLRSAVPLKVGRGGAQEMNAAVRVSNDANALVERLRAQVQETAEEYRRAQGALENVRLTQRTAAAASRAPMDSYGELEEEDVFERADPEGDAPVSDDNKIGNMQSSNLRFTRRLVPHGAPISTPYTSAVTPFEFPDTPEHSDIEDKVRKLNETKQQIDALRGMISKLEGRGGPVPSRTTPRPVPVYGTPTVGIPTSFSQPTVNPAQQRRRQQLHEINRSPQNIETLIQREVTQQNQTPLHTNAGTGTSNSTTASGSAPLPGQVACRAGASSLSQLHQSATKRNLSVSCDQNQNNALRTGVRPRFNSCNNIVQPPEVHTSHELHGAWVEGYNYQYNHLMLDVPPGYTQQGSQPRSLTEAATWGGSSTQDNSDNGEVASDDCTDSEMERLAGGGAVGGDTLADLDPAAAAAATGPRILRGAQPKVREEPAGAVGINGNGNACDHCGHLGTYTQMLTLSLVQANEVINGQQREIERLRAALMRPPVNDVVGFSSRLCPLNNQVTPGLRANNYVDNLKSLSTLNLLNQSTGVGLANTPMVPMMERRPAPSAPPGERNDLGREEDRRRRPNKNSMNNQVNFCSSSSNNNSRYSSNPELNNREIDPMVTAGTSGASNAGIVNGGKVSLAQLSRERLEMQPALDAATAFLTTRAGELCTPDVLIQTCRCLLDQLTPAGVSHKHILRVLQPILGQFLARPVEPSQIVETLSSILQRELTQIAKSGNASPPERTLGAGVSSILDRSTAGNDQNEDTEGASGGDVEGGEEMIEADRGTDDIPPEIPPPPGVVLGPSDREQAGSGASGISIPSLDHVPTREVVQPIQQASGVNSFSVVPPVCAVSSASDAAETAASTTQDINTELGGDN